MGMGNNEEIRGRLELYRTILITINWIVFGTLLVVGFWLVFQGNSSTSQQYNYVSGISAAMVIGGLIIGVVGHFLINLYFSIPFILLNNGDTLAALAGNSANMKAEIPTGNTENSTAQNIPDNIKEETAKGDTGSSTVWNMPDEPKWKCPKCGSGERTIITLRNQNNAIYQCKNCGYQIFA